jgi:hypothetical protein
MSDKLFNEACIMEKNNLLDGKRILWDNWMNRLAGYCERTFGDKWQDTEKDFWDRFPFY